MTTSNALRLTALLVVASIAFGAEPVSAESICTSLKYKAAGKAGFSHAKCQADAARNGLTVDAACLAKADATLAKRWVRAENKLDCVETGELPAVGTAIDEFSAALFVALESPAPTPTPSPTPIPTPTPFPTPTPSPSPTPPAWVVCCSTGTSCFGGVDAFGCDALGGTAGAAGTVCDGVTGTCQPFPAGTGSCCFHPTLTVCEGGPSIDGAACVFAGGLDFPFESRCEPNGTCSFTGP